MKPSEAIANIEYARKWLGSESDFSEEALDTAIAALEKQESKKPLKMKDCKLRSPYSCPECYTEIPPGCEYCWRCGKKIDWSRMERSEQDGDSEG